MLELLNQLFLPIIQSCYDLSGNWWVAIFLFTVIAKIVQFVLSLWSHKNGITMVKLMPDLLRLKVRYFGDKETIEEKQAALYKERHYHTLLGIVPLAFQIVILIGLVGVIYQIAGSGLPGTEALGKVPIGDGGTAWIMPLLAAASAILLGFCQNRFNPLQHEQTRREQLFTNGISVAISLVLGIFVANGIAFYWVCSNVLAIPTQLLCNVCIKPKKHIDYDDLAAARAEYAAIEEAAGSSAPWWKRDPNVRREREDYRRFFGVLGKHIVFYAEGSGFYRYYKDAIEWLLANSDVWIHYLTKDPDDQVFRVAQKNPRLIPYYISERRLITLFMKLDADVVVLSTPELENYYLKRSYLRKDAVYVFMPHHLTSMHMVAGSQHAYDHFDAILCAGPHQMAELERLGEMNGAREQRLFATGYGLLDAQIDEFETMALAPRPAATERAAEPAEGKPAPKAARGRPTVLIAPSWAEDNILDSCIDPLLEQLLNAGRWRVIVRPHPEYVKRYGPRWEALRARYANVPADDLVFEGFGSNASVVTSDIVITDWSSVALEFAFTTCKPVIYVDTPMKVANSEWEAVGLEPVDLSIRNRIGRSVDPADLTGVRWVVADMLRDAAWWAERIRKVRSETVFNLGCGGETAGRQLLALVMEAQAARKRAGEDDAVRVVENPSVAHAEETGTVEAQTEEAEAGDAL